MLCSGNTSPYDSQLTKVIQEYMDSVLISCPALLSCSSVLLARDLQEMEDTNMHDKVDACCRYALQVWECMMC